MEHEQNNFSLKNEVRMLKNLLIILSLSEISTAAHAWPKTGAGCFLAGGLWRDGKCFHQFKMMKPASEGIKKSLK